MPFHFKFFLLLCVTWASFSGIFDNLLLLALGFLSCLLVTLITYAFDVSDDAIHYSIFKPLKLINYLFWLIGQIIMANIEVARIILDPKLPISPGMKTLKITQQTDLGRTIYANSITLTPGTISVLVEKDTILVHSLTEQTYQELAKNKMDARVTRLETAFIAGKTK
ncbi:MAG: Na+/H+ antiporter subunit E [Methylococcales bacterium]